jgi:energy-coupling factor transporter transmembrane protein EcfT
MKATTSFNIHPYSRIVFLICGLVGCAICQNIWLLICFWTAILIPLTGFSGKFKSHIRFLLIGAVPMFILLFVSSLVQSPDTNLSLESVSHSVLRIIGLATVTQLVLAIPLDQTISTFKAWGMKGDTLVLTLGVYTVWTDMVSRADKIITARFARGFVQKRTLLTRLSQVPYLIIPLTIGMMRAATVRSESWNQKNILHRIEADYIDETEYGIVFNTVIITTSFSWLFLNITIR